MDNDYVKVRTIPCHYPIKFLIRYDRIFITKNLHHSHTTLSNILIIAALSLLTLIILLISCFGSIINFENFLSRLCYES